MYSCGESILALLTGATVSFNYGGGCSFENVFTNLKRNVYVNDRCSVVQGVNVNQVRTFIKQAVYWVRVIQVELNMNGWLYYALFVTNSLGRFNNRTLRRAVYF